MPDYYDKYSYLEKAFKNDTRSLDLLYEFHDKSLDYFKCTLKTKFDYIKEQELLDKIEISIGNLNDYIRQTNIAIKQLPTPNKPGKIMRFTQECYRQEE